jgi:membrane protein DedA with SNARE-associated domain
MTAIIIICSIFILYELLGLLSMVGLWALAEYKGIEYDDWTSGMSLVWLLAWPLFILVGGTYVGLVKLNDWGLNKWKNRKKN